MLSCGGRVGECHALYLVARMHHLFRAADAVTTVFAMHQLRLGRSQIRKHVVLVLKPSNVTKPRPT